MAQDKNERLARDFAARFKKALSHKRGDRAKLKEAETDYYDLTRFINNRLSKKEQIEICLNEYLKIYTTYSPSDPRSKFVFTLLILKRIEISKDDDRFIDDLSSILSDDRQPFRTLLRQRFESLEGNEKAEIRRSLGDKKALQKQRASILDVLRKSYVKANNKEPTRQQILDFDPAPDKNLEAKFNAVRNECLGFWGNEDAENIAGGIRNFVAFLSAQKDAAHLFQILKWCRDIVREKPRTFRNNQGELESHSRPHDLLDCELYFQSAFLLFWYAIHHGYSKHYKGFSQHEIDFFLEPLASSKHGKYYFSQYQKRYRTGFTKPNDVEQSTVFFLRVLIFARINDAELVSDNEVRQVIFKLLKLADVTNPQQLVSGKDVSQTLASLQKNHKAILRKKSFDLRVGREILRGKVRIGDRFGKVKVAFFEEFKDTAPRQNHSQTIYVEFVGVGNLLFKISSEQLARFNEESFYTTLWQNTRALLVLMPAMFQLLGYTFSFITGGFSALITDVVVDVVVGEIAEQVDLGPGGSVAVSMLAGSPGAVRGLGRIAEGSAGVRTLGERGVIKDDAVADKALKKAMNRPRSEEASAARAREKWLLNAEANAAQADIRAAQHADAKMAQQVELRVARATQGSPAPKPPDKLTAAETGLVTVRAKESPKGSGSKAKSTRQAADAEESAKQATSGKATQQRDTGNRLRGETKAKPTARPARHRQTASGLPMVTDGRDVALKQLKALGFRFEKKSLKNPKSGGGRYQKNETGESEWKVTSPLNVEAEIDGLAIDPVIPSGLIAVEAKATFVIRHEQSAHMRFYTDKVKQIARQLAISLESERLLRVEIRCSANQVAETYQNMLVQQVGLALKKQFKQQALDYISRDLEKPLRRLSPENLERIVDENVTITISEWP